MAAASRRPVICAKHDTIVDAMLGLSAPSDKAANRLAERKRKDKLNGGIALITGQGNQSQTYIER